MTKKALLKSLPNTKTPKNIEAALQNNRYAIKATEKQIEGNRILLVLLWQNKGGHISLRCDKVIFLNKQDESWNVYDVMTCKWSRASRNYLNIYDRYGIYESRITKETISKYFNSPQKDGWRTLERWQGQILCKRRQRRYQREQQRIDSIMSDVPAVPKDFASWIRNDAAPHFIYYEYSRNIETGFCTRCAREVALRKRPKYGMEDKCPACKKKIIYKTAKKAGAKRDFRYAKIFQKLTDITYIERTFRIVTEMQPGEESKIRFKEVFRTVVSRNFGELESFEHAYRSRTDTAGWGKPLVHGFGYFYTTDFSGTPYTRNLTRLIKNTEMKYIPVAEWLKRLDKKGFLPACTIKEILLSCSRNTNAMEKLIKGGLDRLAWDIVQHNRSKNEGIDGNATTLRNMLGLDITEIRLLRKYDGDLNMYRTIKEAKHGGVRFTEQELMEYLRNRYPIHLIKCFKYSTTHKMLKYLSRLKSEKQYQYTSDMCQEYEDYLTMRLNLGYEMQDEIGLFPRDLKAAHDRMMLESNGREAEMRMREVKREFPQIEQQYRELDKHFHMEKAGFIIRPARSAEEIVCEGREMHHCVGASDNYLSRHCNATSFILMLRKKEAPDQPYITIEASRDGDIHQWYGAYNKKPDKEKMDKLLRKWSQEIKKRG